MDLFKGPRVLRSEENAPDGPEIRPGTRDFLCAIVVILINIIYKFIRQWHTPRCVELHFRWCLLSARTSSRVYDTSSCHTLKAQGSASFRKKYAAFGPSLGLGSILQELPSSSLVTHCYCKLLVTGSETKVDICSRAFV